MEKHLAGAAPSDALSPDILVALTRSLLGDLDAQDMAKICAGWDQPRELRELLRYLLKTEGERLGLHTPPAESTTDRARRIALAKLEDGEGGGRP